MYVSNINPVAFSGLWAPVKKLGYESGVYNRNKAIYTLYEYTYHPYVGESPESIRKEISNHFFGRSFSLWDKFDGQHKADIMQMNFIRHGKPVNKNEAQDYIAKGYRENFSGGVQSDKEFMETYSNETYSPFDISKMSEEYIKDVAKRKFSIDA